MLKTKQKGNKKDNFKELARRLIYRAKIFNLNAVRMKAPGGHRFQHEIIVHPGAAVIIPILKDERFVLIRQFRTAVGKYLWEFPAGTLEDREAPLACAKREIIEETGFRAKKWRKLTSFYPAPGISTEFMHIFLASELIPSEMSLDQDEFIERHIVSFKRLQKMILSGTIVDAKTMIGFFYYCQHRKRSE